MKKGFRTSLIVSTYNWPEALRVCLTSIKSQSVLPGEVIVGDDGSREDTRKLVEAFANNFPVPLIYVWQPDEGFQLARIRNKAIAQTSGDYIVQVDGDLLLHRNFIEDHIAFAEPGHFVTGSRCIMNPELSKKVLENPGFKVNAFSNGTGNFLNGLRFRKLGNLIAKRYKTGRRKYYVKGCNMAFWKKDLLAVNGYNEDFVGWGKEDSEIAIRLMNNGIRKKFLKLQGISYHIYHLERPIQFSNDNLMESAITNKHLKAEKGLDQYIRK